MIMTVIVVCVVSGALLLGAAWGVLWTLPQKLEGFLIAAAGGALIVSAMSELIEPALMKISLVSVTLSVGAGALVFTIVARFIKEKFGEDSGGGLLASVTLDGIPENLVLGVALIGAGPMQIAALAGSIFLSNLPEAAGGAKEMVKNWPKRRVFLLWGLTAVGRRAGIPCRYSLFCRGRGHRIPSDDSVSQGLPGRQLRCRNCYRPRPAFGTGSGRAGWWFRQTGKCFTVSSDEQDSKLA